MTYYFNQYYNFPGINIIWTIFIFFTGLCLGSFLNVVIWRVPQNLSISHPRSFCPKCKHQITAWENIPVISWLLLRGRCHKCHLPISLRYPTIELLTGCLFLITWLLILYVQISPLLFFRFMLLIFWGIAFSMIDIDTQTVPTNMVYWALLSAIILVFILPSFSFNSFFPSIITDRFQFIFQSSLLLQQTVNCLLGIFLGIGFLKLTNWCCNFISPKTLDFGNGDLRYITFIGAILGGDLIFLCLILSAFIAIVFGVCRSDKEKPIPMIPFFSVTALALLIMTILHK